MHVAELMASAGLLHDAAVRRLNHATPADYCNPATAQCPDYHGNGLSQQAVTAISLAIIAAGALTLSIGYGIYTRWCKKASSERDSPVRGDLTVQF